MSTKSERLKEMLKIANDGLSREEFLAAFKKVIDHILKLEVKLIDKINLKTKEEKEKLRQLSEVFDQVIDQAKKDSDSTLAGFRNRTMEAINKLFTRNEVNKKLKELDRKMNLIRDGYDGIDGRDGVDGKDADEEKIIKKVLDELPEPDKGEMNTLKEEIAYLKSRPLGGGGFSKIAMDGHLIESETPTGTVNGTNKDFVLTATPNPPTSLKVYVNGQRLKLTDDYTISKRTISFVTAPPTTSLILVDYRK